MTSEERILAGVGLAALFILVALVAVPQTDTRSDMERAQDRLEQSLKRLEELY